ncbi:hypothetical protein ERO13_A03G017864v2 [Gossypium hirsutum]|uniref:Agenet domain-containing protein n=3 Tax=Gossypium TaxID=3633 RepID=A0A5J5W9J5_GOSBA|nr:hypothetical protein ES319_A03G022900v1 [Gossypium barbadense]KAG4206547.1 hypothetical protein ERO13_A03G017864v2 [Gossypium hirsutum]TYH23599.1 hypothetical protein ES288_A03G026400v1 [Gossypium darwinii]TYI34694.1 hypothetical protein ES332_A03G026200v1 [Gossypium tomentosum]
MSQKGKCSIGVNIEGPPHLQPGSTVEIKPPEFGYQGAWYTASIIQRKTPISSKRFMVQFTHLFQDEKTGKRPVRMFSVSHIRPQLPPLRPRKFKQGEDADAYHKNGWWEGVILQEWNNGNYLFMFHSDNQWPKYVEFGVNQLRLHRTWFNGYWVPPVQESELAVEEVQREQEYNEGDLVEVRNDEDGSNRSWFAAVIVKPVGNKRHLIQYMTLETEDNTDFLEKEVDTSHIRPRPPDIVVPDQFVMLDQVDAFYKGGWWKGVIIKVLSDDSKYHVYLATHEEMEFKHDELRLHQDWIDGKWTKPSPGVCISKPFSR